MLFLAYTALPADAFARFLIFHQVASETEANPRRQSAFVAYFITRASALVHVSLTLEVAMQSTLTMQSRRKPVPVSTGDSAPESKPVSVGYEAVLAERVLEAVQPVPSQSLIERKEVRREPYHLD